MSRNRFLILAFLVLPFGMFPAAADTVSLTLDEAVQRALDQSINLQKSAINLAQAEFAASNLWAEIYRSSNIFSLSAGLSFGTPLFTEPGFSINEKNLSYSLSFGVSLPLNFSLRSSMNNIELAYRAQLLSYEDARRQLEIQVIKNYLILITQKENITLMEESLAVVVHQLENDRIARANGHLSELSWLNSQLNVETSRFNLSNAQGAYQIALGEFLALLGMDAATDIIFQETIEITQVQSDAERLIIEYLPKRPDIIRQRQTIESLENSKNATIMSNRLPSLNLSTQWQGSPASNGGIGAPFSDRVSGSLTVNIPIDSWIPGTRQNQAIRSADAEVEKAILDLQNTEAQAKTQIRSIIANLNNTWNSIEIARLRVDIAKRTVIATEEGFRSGTVESRDLEDIRRELTNVQLRLLQEEYTYQSLLLDLAAALNVDWKTLTRQQINEGFRQ